jgi:hypothetical protein
MVSHRCPRSPFPKLVCTDAASELRRRCIRASVAYVGLPMMGAMVGCGKPVMTESMSFCMVAVNEESLTTDNDRLTTLLVN